MRPCLVIILFAYSLHGATFYVATNGNNGNVGSSGSPWLTIQYGVTNASVGPGDTVLVQPGVFNERVIVSKGGTSEVARLTIKANGAGVTNLGSFTTATNYITIDGFDMTTQGLFAQNGQAISIGNDCSYINVVNCVFHDNPASGQEAVRSEQKAGVFDGNANFLIISNNFFHDWAPNNSAQITFFGGSNNLVVNNVISNTYGGDFIRPWGANHVIRGNVVKHMDYEIARIVGAGNAAFNTMYFIATNLMNTNFLGAHGFLAYTNVNGYVLVDYGAGLAENPKPTDDGFTNKWNLVNSNRSITYAASPQPYGTWTMYESTIVSAPTNGAGAMDHPDMIQVWGSYVGQNTNATFYPGQKSTNILFENNWIEAGDGIAGGTCGQVNTDCGMNTPLTVHDWTIRNNVFVKLLGGSYDAQNIQFYNNTFFGCGSGWDSSKQRIAGNTSISFGWYDPSGSSPRGESFGLVISNNAFIACGRPDTSAGWYGFAVSSEGSPGGYSVDTISNGMRRCDYNYVCNDTSWAQKSVSPGWGSNAFKFYEPHGINGGDPKIAYLALNNFHLMKTSPLIDAGFALAGATNDMEGAVRPLGSAPDIGAYELDPALQMRLDFGADPVANHKILDITGNGHDAMQQDPTNWITVAGSTPRFSGHWYTNGTMTDGSTIYTKAQFGAISNINTISNLTSGTIMFWVAWNTNYVDMPGLGITNQPEPERFDTIMDAGDLVNFAGAPQYTTNSWAFEFGPFSGTPGNFNFKRWQTNAYVDTSTVLITWTNQNRLVPTNQWWHDAVTWTAGGNMIGYENGQPFTTNSTWGMPYLQVGGASPGWICLGAMQHSGPLTWPNNVNGHGGYPNAGYFKGNLTDIRIYNRALGSNEIASIYAAATGGATGGGGSPPVPPVNTFSAGTIRAGRVSKP